MSERNGQNPPCLICGQEMKQGRVYGPADGEGPLCSRECARTYFVARQIASVRSALIDYLKRSRLIKLGE